VPELGLLERHGGEAKPGPFQRRRGSRAPSTTEGDGAGAAPALWRKTGGHARVTEAYNHARAMETGG
jgi:hypothetical protein